MSDYTPSTGQMLDAWALWRVPFLARKRWFPTAASAREVTDAEFDRWLAEVERAVAEKAWEDGAEAAFYNPEIRGLVDYPDDNPYRATALGLNEGEVAGDETMA